jgi:hypothetical protein
MKIIVQSLAVIALLAGCGDSTYTLYRSQVSNENARTHVATFDASDGQDYNKGNCEIAQDLFQKQSGVTVKYWCEKGQYKK